MAASKKRVEDAKRLKYVRALERFHKSIHGFLHNTEELTHEAYVKKIDNALKVLHRVEVVQLYKGELQDLEKLVKKIIDYKESDEAIESIKSDVLYSSNQLEKSKNKRRYKKEKYSHSQDEWE